MRPDSSVVLRQFLAAYLASPQAQEWMKRRYFGMDMPRINVEDARAIPVALPPLQEQVEIVRLLRQAQEALAQIETVVNSASRAVEALPRAILSKAFSGTLVPTEAEVARLEGRDYEPASALLERIRASKARERPVRTQRRKAMPLPTRARRRA
jgi:type I restriction enzyme S subunit